MVTIIDGTLFIPAYNKFQQLSIPFGAKTTFEVTNPDEVNYWENIKVNGAKVEVTNGLITPVNEWTYTAVTIVNTGTTEAPVYSPAYAANTYYAPAKDGGEPAQDATAIASDTGWGTTVTKVYTRAKTQLPTNDVVGV